MAGKKMIGEFHSEAEDRKLILKEEIKKSGGNCAKMLLILAISTYGIGFVIIFMIKLINIILSLSTTGNFHGNNILGISKDTYNFLIGYLPCIIGDIIAIIIGMKATKIKIKQDIFNKNKSTKRFILLGAVSCIGMGMFSSIIYALYSSVFTMLRITIPKPDFTFPEQKGYLIIFLIYVCFLGPVLEEIIFRGFILKSMQKYGNLTAILVSSIMFSMFHLNLVQFVNPVLIGIILAFIAIKSESIIPSVIAHMFNNTLTFLVAAVSLLKIPLLEGILDGLCFLIGIAALIIFIVKYKCDFLQAIKEDTAILKTYEKIKFSFSGAWGIGYISFYTIFIVGTTIITSIIKMKN